MNSKLKAKIRNYPRIHKSVRKIITFPAYVKTEASYIFTDIRELPNRDELIPPMRMRNLVGRAEDFKLIGQTYLRALIEFGELKPNERVLDVGCGIGRVAGPLTKYLNEQGSYEGFDIVPKEIKWAKKTFESRFPNFHFQLADVYNKCYNPKGKFKASEYKFPFESESFDFVFLTSVFSHILKEDMENYFTEITRVLKPKGRCLISFCLLNTHSLEMIEKKKATANFQYEINGYRTIDREIPESAVAYDEKIIRALFDKNKLSIIEPIHFGGWSERKPSPLSLQDIIVAVK